MSRLDPIKQYYGETLQRTEDLKTNACCTIKNYPPHISEVFALIHPEVMEKFYGCGLTIPTALDGLKVLDLGSGSGRDCYLLSKLVGPTGKVVGVDMTPEQFDVANRHREYHRQQFGYSESNVEFILGDIEKLDLLNFEDASFDLIISNCVINLCQNKQAVLQEAYRLLRPGGELYFSDVYSDRRIPPHLLDDQVLRGECLSGALYWNDFITLAKQANFHDPRMMEQTPITIENSSIAQQLEGINFHSITYRLFKLDQLERSCEDYHQSATYRGGVAAMEDLFILDQDHHFKLGHSTAICGNSFRMLNQSRFNRWFDFSGDFEHHYGPYSCCNQSSPPMDSNSKQSGGSCC
ncbi:MAG: methyltransferase domain-containing protein [Bdellovibrionales bacterium]|nr:methyltransferase domain-containing protein [Bdellovibrionales bacterium]